MDARLESAQRASQLHHKRTGKRLNVSREIVEKEAMYEELDERYQEKRVRMLQAQNLQIEEQLNRQLLAALAVRAGSQHSIGQNHQGQHRGSTSSASSSSASSVSVPSLASMSARSSSMSSASPASMVPQYGVHKKSHSQQLQQTRRASSMTPRAVPMDGMRKMSLDLSSLRSPGSQGVQTGPLTSPMVMDHGYMVSPVYESFPNNTQGDWYSQQQVPSYIQQPQWQPQWTPGFQQQQQPPPPPQHQQSVSQDSGMSQMAEPSPVRSFRDRFASAPEISLQGLPNISTAMPTTPIQQQQQKQPKHAQMQSESAVPMMTMQQPLPTPISKPASPKTQSVPYEAYPSPDTPQASPKSLAPLPAPVLDTTDAVCSAPQAELDDAGLLFSGNSLDPDFDEFNQFALGLGGNVGDLPERDLLAFDEFVALDDFTVAA